MAEVALGLGGNLGDPVATIEAALAALDAAGLRILRRSAFYRTPPWGPVAQPDFVNLCALAETRLGPRVVLGVAQATERQLGREPGSRWGPRAIDIDILTWGDLAVDDADLTIPHPRLTERAFVLVPLAEIAPNLIIRGRIATAWLDEVDATGIRKLDPRP